MSAVIKENMVLSQFSNPELRENTDLLQQFVSGLEEFENSECGIGTVVRMAKQDLKFRIN